MTDVSGWSSLPAGIREALELCESLAREAGRVPPTETPSRMMELRFDARNALAAALLPLVRDRERMDASPEERQAIADLRRLGRGIAIKTTADAEAWYAAQRIVTNLLQRWDLERDVARSAHPGGETVTDG